MTQAAGMMSRSSPSYEPSILNNGFEVCRDRCQMKFPRADNTHEAISARTNPDFSAENNPNRKEVI
jgi:hypothetical protein